MALMWMQSYMFFAELLRYKLLLTQKSEFLTKNVRKMANDVSFNQYVSAIDDIQPFFRRVVYAAACQIIYCVMLAGGV